jgi:RNA polymerase sigma-70 factor (sigma-E family)
VGEAPATFTPTTLPLFAREQALTLTRFAYLMCGDRHRAEDLVQETLLAMHRRFGDALPLADPLAYARRAIVNANISWSRRHWSRDLLVDEVPDRPVEPPDRSRRDELWAALATLPPRQRAVLVLRYYAGYDDPAIAELIGARRTTVRSLAARGLHALRPLIETEPGKLNGGQR